MTKAVVPNSPAETVKAGSDTPNPIVIDLGKQKRKRIRRLRKGRGRLMARIIDTHAQLKATGVCEESAQPIVIVVRQKKKRGWW
jgi:hypothetical protein